MSGHSKWSNIKRKKEATDSKKASIFSRLGKEITIAVKSGGGADQSINRKLKDVVAKAKGVNMPMDNINRCIQKASGDAQITNYEEIIYEGFGPCGVSVIVEALTDNKNRAAADIRCIFTKSGGTFGQTGSVSYMFEKKGYILIERTNEIDDDTLMMDALESGADDIVCEIEYFEIFSTVENFSLLRETMDNKGYILMDAEIKQIPTIKKELNEEEEEQLQKFLDKLDENDDVQNVWHNADI
ncbi:MAG: YebC/PmpR family DNA-binding transcriptional regulator [Clostridia bacterium]